MHVTRCARWLAWVVLGVVALTGLGCGSGEAGGASGAVAVPVATPAEGSISGTVTDAPESLPSGQAARLYPGAIVSIRRAKEAGTFRRSAAEPEQTSYEAAEEVAKPRTGQDGTFSAQLPAGAYFVRAFYGERSYSADVLVHVRPGEVAKVELGLTGGV